MALFLVQLLATVGTWGISVTLNILMIMWFWGGESVDQRLWLIQSILPCLIYSKVTRYVKRTYINFFGFLLGILIPLSSLFVMDIYLLYVYSKGFGKSLAALWGFVPYILHHWNALFHTFWETLRQSWWRRLLYSCNIVCSAIFYIASCKSSFLGEEQREQIERKALEDYYYLKFRLPAQLIQLLTFPGVMIHELGNELFCYLMDIEIYEVCYFQWNKESSGYVLRASTDSLVKEFFAFITPFLLNSILSFGAFSLGFLLFDLWRPLFFLFIWLGVSMGIHSFRSDTPLWAMLYGEMKKGNFLAWILSPVMFLFWVFTHSVLSLLFGIFYTAFLAALSSALMYHFWGFGFSLI